MTGFLFRFVGFPSSCAAILRTWPFSCFLLHLSRLLLTIQGARPALCEAPSSRHMREYYLRCLVESLLTDRLREARTEDTAGTRGEESGAC